MPSIHHHSDQPQSTTSDVTRERERAPAPRSDRRATPRWWKASRLGLLLLPLSLALAPASAQAGRYGHGHHHGSHSAYATGTLVIDNDRGEPVAILVDGRSQGVVSPYGTERISLRTGSHSVELRDRTGRVIQRETLSLGSRSTAYVEIDRVVMGMLAVSNPLERPVQLLLNGQRRLTLAPFQHSSVQVPVGTIEVQLALTDGRVIASQRERIERYGVSTWYPRPAMVGELRLENPLPIAVMVDLGQGRRQYLRAHGSLRLDDQSEGRRSLRLYRAEGGELVGTVAVRIEAFETARAEVPQPRKGILVVDNDRRRGVEVLVDGRSVGRAEAGQQARLQLSPGRHRVELVSQRSGRLLDSRELIVGRYEPLRISVPESSHRDHDHDYDRYEEDDQLSLGFGFGDGGWFSASVDLD